MHEHFNDDIKRKTIDQQQAKMDTYTALVTKGLPVPTDLRAEVESAEGYTRVSDFNVVTPMESTAEKGKRREALSRSLRFGPVAWCKRCHREHRRGACELVPEERTIDHDNRRGRRRGRPATTQLRLVHPKPRKKAVRKRKARKS